MKIYEIEKALSEIFWAIESSDDDVTLEQFEKIKELQLERKQKFEGIANHLINLRYEADAIKIESKKLAERAKSVENKIRSYEGFLEQNLPEGGVFGNRVILWKKNPPSVEITGEVPKDFMREKISYEPNKTEIKKELQLGVALDFASLVQKKRLEIK